MRIYCWYCHKSVSTELPDDVLFRAIAVCPECTKNPIADPTGRMDKLEMFRLTQKLAQTQINLDKAVKTIVVADTEFKKANFRTAHAILCAFLEWMVMEERNDQA